jgi:HlyD family secretion protein
MIALVAIAAVVVVILAAAQARFGSSAMDIASMQSAGGVASVPVTFATVRDARSTIAIEAPADVAPYLTQNIVTRVPGLLTELSAYTGDRLRAGEAVARLQEPELQSDAEAAAAQAQAAQYGVVMAHHDEMIARADLAAKAEQKRYWDGEIAREKTLLQQGAVSRREFDDERAQTVAAQSAYEAAQMKLASTGAAVDSARAQAAGASATAASRSTEAGYASVIVPDDSVVVKRLVDPGVYVQAGTPILQVAVIDRVRVAAQVAQGDLVNLRVGTPADVVARNGSTLRGRVTSLSPVADPQTHTALAEIVVTNDGNALVPGGFVHVILHARTARAARGFVVPSGAVTGGSQPAVWIDQRGSAHRVPVSLLSDDGATAAVVGDLRTGMRVVATGAANLEEGQAIAAATP